MKRIIKRAIYRTLDRDTRRIIDEILSECIDKREWYETYLKSNAPRIKKDARLLMDFISPQASIIDIGAIPPLLSGILHAKGIKNLTVVDPNACIFKKYFEKNKINYFDADILKETDQQMEGRFDLVCLCEVIEHLGGNLVTSIERVISYIRPGGLLFITTPNLKSLSGLVALTFYNSGLASKPRETVREQYNRAEKTGYYGHLREFTRKEVVELVESFGLKHKISRFQADYRKRPLNLILGIMEWFFPRYRLFGKYLFNKPL